MGLTNIIISLLYLFYGCAKNSVECPQVDCFGKCNGTAIVDECGVCNGDGSSCSLNPFGTDETLDVITWNIEFFPKENDTTVEKVVAIIEQLNVDIIALQEIESNEYFNNLIDQYNIFLR